MINLHNTQEKLHSLSRQNRTTRFITLSYILIFHFSKINNPAAETAGKRGILYQFLSYRIKIDTTETPCNKLVRYRF